jgi:hypothetical protein
MSAALVRTLYHEPDELSRGEFAAVVAVVACLSFLTTLLLLNAFTS